VQFALLYRLYVIYSVVSLSCDLFYWVTFVRFTLLYDMTSFGLHDVVKILCPLTIEPKSVTLTFDRRISEVAFVDLTILLVFGLMWVCLNCVLGFSFSSKVLFLNPLHFNIASFFIRGLFLSPLRFEVAYFSSEVFFS
jgi:hypothetical protein